MNYLFLCYPKCSTCRKAEAFLKENGIAYTFRDIALDRPAADELRRWFKAGGLPLKRFFNTSGMRYREEGLSERLPGMSEDEQIALLATDGMLVKRPLLIGEDGGIRVGFRPAEWETLKH